MLTPVVRRDAPLRVSVVSAQKLTRAGVMQLLKTDPKRVCVVEVDPERHVDTCDVTVYDLADLISASGIELVRLMARKVPVVGLARPGRPDLTQDALTIGLATTVSMNVTAQGLVDAVEEAAWCHRPDEVARTGAHREAIRASACLSRREMEILELIVGGLTNKEIAARLWLSMNSVKTYIRGAYRKIGVTRRPEAVLWGCHHGLMETGVEARPGG
jgi:DNA-binding NarL/FixJ family response regulator